MIKKGEKNFENRETRRKERKIIFFSFLCMVCKGEKNGNKICFWLLYHNGVKERWKLLGKKLTTTHLWHNGHSTITSSCGWGAITEVRGVLDWVKRFFSIRPTMVRLKNIQPNPLGSNWTHRLDIFYLLFLNEH